MHITIQNAIPQLKSQTELWGAGDWFFAADPVDGSAALHITAATALSGVGTARFGVSQGAGSVTDYAATMFHIPDALTGVKAWHSGMSFPRGSGGGRGTIIRGILFTGEGRSSPNAHGLDMRTRRGSLIVAFQASVGTGSTFPQMTTATPTTGVLTGHVPLNARMGFDASRR